MQGCKPEVNVPEKTAAERKQYPAIMMLVLIVGVALADQDRYTNQTPTAIVLSEFKWPYAQFQDDPTTKSFKPNGNGRRFGKDQGCHQCHTRAEARDNIFTNYPPR